MKTFLAVFFGILAAAAVIAGIFGYFWVRQSVSDEQKTYESLTPLNLRTLSTACETYKSTYGYFPTSLADLGSVKCAAFSGPHCAGLIDENLASGKLFKYVSNYQPRKVDARGRVVAYVVTATRTPENKKAKENYFVDETGVIRSTAENRPARADDAPWLDETSVH